MPNCCIGSSCLQNALTVFVLATLLLFDARENDAKPKSAPSSKDAGPNKESVLFVGESTKIVIVNASCESGLIVGGEEVKKDDKAQTNSTAYSVTFLSPNPNHTAVVLKLEEVNFEPAKFCANEMISLSYLKDIVSVELNGTSSTDPEPTGETSRRPVAWDDILTEFFNRPSIGNTSRPRLATHRAQLKFDLVFNDACQSIFGTGDGKIPAKCNTNDENFKILMYVAMAKLGTWNRMKLFCGTKVRRLIIPYRSFKLSVSSDEFTPDPRFKIRYEFISDPKLLPTHDNGKYYCRNRNVIDLSSKCDGYDDCGDASDESMKVCGYRWRRRQVELKNKQSGRARADQKKVKPSDRSDGSNTQGGRVPLLYYEADAVQCCQPSDWPVASSPISSLNKTIKATSAPMKRVKRVVGGSEVNRGDWPAQVSLQTEIAEPLSHYCGGTLVHPEYVLTASHCLKKNQLNFGIKLIFGAHDVQSANEVDRDEHIQVRYADDILLYPGVDPRRFGGEWQYDASNDLALLHLNAPVSITTHVKPACLPPPDALVPVKSVCQGIGWGRTQGTGNFFRLKQFSLRLADEKRCSSVLKDLYEDTIDLNSVSDLVGNRDEVDAGESRTLEKNVAHNNKVQSGRNAIRLMGLGFESQIDPAKYSNHTLICGDPVIGRGFCDGDSGGPLYCDRVTSDGDRCTTISGVASFMPKVGVFCAVNKLPIYFSEVSYKLNWIWSSIKMFEQAHQLEYPDWDLV